MVDNHIQYKVFNGQSNEDIKVSAILLFVNHIWNISCTETLFRIQQELIKERGK